MGRKVEGREAVEGVERQRQGEGGTTHIIQPTRLKLGG